jgi:hypothetical protein
MGELRQSANASAQNAISRLTMQFFEAAAQKIVAIYKKITYCL